MLVHNLSECCGPGKLRAYWESNAHIVVKHTCENSPVYEVVSERNPKSNTQHCIGIYSHRVMTCQLRHKMLIIPEKSSNKQHHFQQKQNTFMHSKRASLEAQATSDIEDDDFALNTFTQRVNCRTGSYGLW